MARRQIFTNSMSAGEIAPQMLMRSDLQVRNEALTQARNVHVMQGGGIRIWGARTLSTDPSWRYINVRRLFIMVESSIERATQGYVPVVRKNKSTPRL